MKNMTILRRSQQAPKSLEPLTSSIASSERVYSRRRVYRSPRKNVRKRTNRAGKKVETDLRVRKVPFGIAAGPRVPPTGRKVH